MKNKTSKLWQSWILIAVCITTLVGCMSVGTNIDTSKISKIKKGVTTEADLLNLFGEPNQQSVSGNGLQTMEWTYVQSNITAQSFIPVVGDVFGGAKSANKSLRVTLGGNGKVQDFSANFGGTEARQNRFGTTQ
jgi:hypothetical protein